MPRARDKPSESHLHHSSFEGLDELQARLFLHITEAKEEPTIFSLSDLAKSLDRDVESIVSALEELQDKKYIRYRRVSDKNLPKIEDIKNSSIRNFKQAFSTTEQISILLTKKKDIPEKVYKKILGELNDKLEETTDRLEKARSQAKIELDRIKTRILELKDANAEMNVRIAIKAIDEKEGLRLIDSYKEELSSLENESVVLLDIFSLPISENSTDESDLSLQREILQTRREVGETSEEEYKRQIESLDKVISEVKKEDNIVVIKNETLKRLKAFQKDQILPEKLAQRVINELESSLNHNQS